MSLSAISKQLRAAVFERDGGRCRYCRLRQFGQGAVFHVNHIVPRSRGGETSIGNLALQCPYCSLHKADKVDARDPKTLELTALFHPLRQEWHEHFVLLDNARLAGLTSTGRTTIDALHMNDAIPRTARALQKMLGLT